MKIQKFLIKNNKNIEYDFDDTENFLIRFRYKILDILEYNKKITKLSQIFDIIKKDTTFGVTSPKEKYTNLYGEEEGTKRFNNKKTVGVTLDNMIKKYGEEEGTKRFNIYREKQAYTNSLEYKSKKYGMSKEEFDIYNRSRSITLDNMIKKYGEEEGTKRFNIYREKQAYTNTKEHLGDRYEKVCFLKGHTIEAYTERLGDIELATKKLEDFYSSSNRTFYSKISQEFFDKLVPHLTDKELEHTYYATKNKEYCVNDGHKTHMYDFVCTELEICIEFHGDHYHGNPKLYKPDDKLKGRGQNGKTAKEAWLTDKIKEDNIKNNRNYDYICVWESDYKENSEKIIEKIERIINEKRTKLLF